MLDLLRPEAHHGDPDMGFALQEPPLEKHREGIADLGPGHAKFSGKLSLSKPLHFWQVASQPQVSLHRLARRFLAQNGKPWLALMPNWVCAKGFYEPALSGVQTIYVVPRKRYHYWTPKGRRDDVSSGGAKAKTHGHTNAALGARTSPFVSFWYGGGFPGEVLSSMVAPEGCHLCTRVEQIPPATA